MRHFHRFTFNGFRFPYNWKTPIGYFISLIIQYASLFSTLAHTLPAGCFLLGSCLVFFSLAEDAKNKLTRLRVEAGTPDQEVLGHFCSIVRFYSNVKELSERGAHNSSLDNSIILEINLCNYSLQCYRLFFEFNGLMEFSVLVVFLWTLIILCLPLVLLYYELVEYKILI